MSEIQSIDFWICIINQWWTDDDNENQPIPNSFSTAEGTFLDRLFLAKIDWNSTYKHQLVNLLKSTKHYWIQPNCTGDYSKVGCTAGWNSTYITITVMHAGMWKVSGHILG